MSVGQGAHDVEREVRHLIHHEEEFPLIQDGKLRLLPYPRRAGRGTAVHHRDEAQHVTGAANVGYLAMGLDLDRARLHHIDILHGLAFAEQDGAPLEGHVGAGIAREHPHVDLLLARSL